MRRAVALWVLVAGGLALPASAEPPVSDRLTLSGDFRLRAETDWDSQDAAGVEREDRTRIRVRLRAGARYEIGEHWRVEARLRSGAEASHQSPHVTILDLDGNDTGDASFDLDRWYVHGRSGGISAWAGRNNPPFWKQNEMLLDDDVTMAGVAAGWEGRAGSSTVTLYGGYFTPPVGMRGFAGELAAVQLVYRAELAGARWTLALGEYRFEAEPDDPEAGLLLQGNGLRDYDVLAASAEVRWTLGDAPLALGGDLLHNREDYDPGAPDPVTAASFDQTDGYVLQATYGGLDEKGRWLAGYTFAHVEALAVNSSFAQDDWVRWGSSTQTRGSDLEGHELRFGWAFDARLNLLARLYLVESITTPEDGNRFRLDLNWRF